MLYAAMELLIQNLWCEAKKSLIISYIVEFVWEVKRIEPNEPRSHTYALRQYLNPIKNSLKLLSRWADINMPVAISTGARTIKLIYGIVQRLIAP
jgi:hypothetical protein